MSPRTPTDTAQSASPLLEPYARYALCREREPVARGSDGIWHVYRYADVKRVISSHAEFSSRVSFGANLMGETMIRQDPPEHRRLRNLANQAFTPRRVARLRPRIAEVARELLKAAEGPPLDVIRALAAPMPIMVITELLGADGEDSRTVKTWSEVVMSHGAAERADAARVHAEMEASVKQLIERQRRSPQDTLLGALVRAEVDEGRLTPQELLGFCYLLLLAGNETTTNLIGNAALCLALHPDVLDRLRADRSLIPTAVEETLRYLAPVQIIVRIAATDVRLGDALIARGDRVLAYVGSANRDPAQFSDPDSFRLDRHREQHLSFGHGIHYCLGAELGRLIAIEAIDALLDRLPGQWRIHGGPLRPVPPYFLCGAAELPLSTWPDI